MTRNYILLSGGPGLYDPQDPEHDQSWANYVTPPLQQTRTRQAQASFQEADEEVWWFICRPAYDRRWTDDQGRTDRRHETRRVMRLDCGGRLCRSYVDLLEYRARVRGWNLRWISSAEDFWRRLRTLRDSISRVHYWGHARNDLWLSLEHNRAHQAIAPSADEIIRISDIPRNSRLQNRFQAGSSSRRHVFSGCNTHRFACEWARVFRVYARGYEGTLRFTTTTHTGTAPGAGCVLRDYAPGGSCEALHETTSSPEYIDRLEEAFRNPTSRPASEGDTLAEVVHATGIPAGWALPDPEELYDDIVYNGDRPLPATIAQSFTVLARPGEAPEASPRAGDILLRVALGEPGIGHVAVLTESTLWPHQRLASAPFRSESHQPGYYAPVIESGIFPHTRADPFARRVLDAEGRMLPGQLLLSPKSAIDDTGSLSARAEELDLEEWTADTEGHELDPMLLDLAEEVMGRETPFAEQQQSVRWTRCFSATDIARVRRVYEDNAAAASANTDDRCACIVMLNVALGQLLPLRLRRHRARSRSHRFVQMGDLTTETIERAMQQLRRSGFAVAPTLVNFYDRRGRTAGTLRPERLQASVRDRVLAQSGLAGCWLAFGLSIMDGYHSALLLVDRTGADARIYWLDQFSSGLTDDVTASLDDRLTRRTQQWWQAVMDRRGIGFNTVIRFWPLRKPQSG